MAIACKRMSLSFMQPFGKLAVLLAAVGVGMAPSAVLSSEPPAQLAQKIYLPQPKLNVPSLLLDSASDSNQPKTPSSGSSDKQSSVEKKPNSNKKDRIKSKEDSKKEKKKKKKKKDKKDKKNKKPSVTTTPIWLTPQEKKPSDTKSPKQPKQGKKRRRSYLTLRKPSLLCRSFKKNGTLVRGFKSRLYGRNTSAVASGLKSNLNSYQASGGSLSRCRYSGVISPSSFTKYFRNRKPARLIRASDNYSLPVYSSYSSLYAASGGRRSRFGLIATTPSFNGANGRREMLKITANNALILFVDSRNQSFFNAPSSRLPLRLINLSPKVSKVLSDASKSSLRRIIDFKKRKRSSGKQSLLPAYQGGFSQTSDVTPFSPQELSRVGLLSDWNFVQIASLEKGLSAVFDSRQLLLAEVDPQIAEYCMNAQDFSGCVETMQGSSEQVYPGSEDSSSDYADSEFEDEYAEGEDDSEFEDEYAEGEDDSEFEDEYAEGEDDSEFEDEYAGAGDDDEFNDGSGMYPEDMGAPTAQACTGDTFGEQLACALISALSTLLQQAFASN